MSRASKIRQAAILRRRVLLVEKAHMPKIAAEIKAEGERAERQYISGGMTAVEMGQEEHIENLAGLLKDLYDDSLKVSGRYVQDSIGKSRHLTIERKDAFAQVFELLAAFWNTEAFVMAQTISETTIKTIRDTTVKALFDGLSEVEIGARIREVQTDLSVSRSQTIARTETHQAIMKSQHDIVADLDLPPYVREWVSGSDGRVRKSHKAADGQLRKPGEPFDVGGDKLMYPGERGGKPENVINCLLPDAAISFFHPKKLFRRRYVGEIVDIKLNGFPKLSVTANHPVLTDMGFKPARLINEGDNLVVDAFFNRVASVDTDIERVNTTVSELFYSLVESGNSPRSSAGIMDFHGDIFDSNVEIIDIGGSLMDSFEPSSNTSIKDFLLKFSETARICLMNDSSVNKFLFRSLCPSNSIVSSFGDFLSLVRSCVFEPNDVGFASAPGLESELLKAEIYRDSVNIDDFGHLKDRDLFMIKLFNSIDNSLPYSGSFDSKFFDVFLNGANANAEGISYFLSAFPLLVKLLGSFLALSTYSKTLSLEVVRSSLLSHYDGYVYNIEDEKVFYNASGIVNRNCRCVETHSFDEEDILKAP